MINPIHHASTPEAVATYKVEPYVVAADVYAVAPHTGRGGWTWYTGSAGWMYRLVMESLLGLQVEHGKLRVKPCVPADWAGFQVRYRHHETRYQIAVVQAHGPTASTRVTLDGVAQADGAIALVNDGGSHAVEIHFSAGLATPLPVHLPLVGA